MAAAKAAGSVAIEVLKLDVVRWLMLAMLIAAFLLFIRWMVRSSIREFKTSKETSNNEETEE